MTIVGGPQARQRAVLVVDIALYVEVARDLDGSIVAELQKAATLVNEPKLTHRCIRRHLLSGVRPPYDDALLHISFLWNQ
jgi:hypothetical protein